LSSMIRYLASWANIRRGETCAGRVANIASDLIQAFAWHGPPITGDLLWVPHSANLSRSRIVDETAPVTILDPAHPIFRWPNRIMEQDFGG